MEFYLKVFLILSYLIASCFLLNLDFLLSHSAHVSKSFSFPKFAFANLRFYFVCFSTLQAIQWHCFINILWWTVEVFKFWIDSFISSYSFNTLFKETNSSWLIYELIKAVEIKTLLIMLFIYKMLFNLNYWLILFNSCSCFTNFNSYCRTRNVYRNAN